MSDISDPGIPADTTPTPSINDILDRPEPGAPAEPTTPEAPATPDSGGTDAPAIDFENLSTDDDLPESVQDFPREYVEKLRREAASRRASVKPYEEAFDGYDDASRDAVLGLAHDLIHAPESAAARMIEISRELLGDQFDAALTEDPTTKPLTRADLDRIQSEREATQQQEQAVQAVIKEAQDLGYADGTPDQATLFYFANTETGGDLNKAHEKVQARNQAIIDKYLEDKRASGDAYVTPTTAGSGGGNESGAPKDLAEARARTMAMLGGTPGA